MRGLLRVGEVAALTGLSPRAVRMYEQLGLLGSPARTSGGYRLYGGMALAQLVRIRHLRELGLGLQRIREVLDPGTPISLDAALAMVQDDLDAQMRRLQAVRVAIGAVRATAGFGREDPAWQRLLAAVDDAGTSDTHRLAVGATVESPLSEVAADRLRQLAARPEWEAVSARLAALRDAGWDAPQIGEVAAGLAAMVPVELLPDELTAPQGYVMLVGRRASPAQVRCLLEAGRLARSANAESGVTDGGTA